MNELNIIIDIIIATLNHLRDVKSKVCIFIYDQNYMTPIVFLYYSM